MFVFTWSEMVKMIWAVLSSVVKQMCPTSIITVMVTTNKQTRGEIIEQSIQNDP